MSNGTIIRKISCFVLVRYEHHINFLFVSEDTHGNDMYYMVTALAEFTKKIMQLAYKNSITL